MNLNLGSILGLSLLSTSAFVAAHEVQVDQHVGAQGGVVIGGEKRINAPLAPQSEGEFREELGRATWKLLHTMAAKYPELPSEARKRRTAKFFELLGHLFPCPTCSRHFRSMIKTNPPKLKSQSEFSRWLCEIHNIVNARLGKQQFPCEDVDSKYDCGCNLESEDDSVESFNLLKNDSEATQNKAQGLTAKTIGF